MSRKAQVKLLVQILAILIAAVILIMLVMKIYGKYDSRGLREKCSVSVQYQAQIGLANIASRGPKPGFLDIYCHTFVVEFYDDRVEIDRKPIEVMAGGKTAKKFDELTDDIVNQVLAYEMAWCWKQFHQGKMDIFNKEFTDVLNRGKVCFVCSDITFKTQKPSFSGFYQYLKDNGNVEFGDKTYYEYLSDDDGRFCASVYSSQGNCWEAYMDAETGGITGFFFGSPHAKLTRDINFDTNRRYSIFFVREGVRANSPGTYFTYIVPASELNRQCDMVLPTR